MAKHPTPPIPISRWFQDSKSVDNLRQTLSNPAFQQAVAILKEIAGPSFNTLSDDDTNARRHAWYGGYRDAFNDLEKLTKYPEDKRNSSSSFDEWTHIE